MNVTPTASAPSKSTGYFMAVAIGAITVLLVTALFLFAISKPLTSAADTGLLFQILIASLPFIFLVRKGVWDRMVWFLGVVLTVVFWGYYLSEGIRYQLTGGTGGADIGLGLIMLFSPVIISAACLIAARIRRKVV